MFLFITFSWGERPYYPPSWELAGGVACRSLQDTGGGTPPPLFFSLGLGGIDLLWWGAGWAPLFFFYWDRHFLAPKNPHNTQKTKKHPKAVGFLSFFGTFGSPKWFFFPFFIDVRPEKTNNKQLRSPGLIFVPKNTLDKSLPSLVFPSPPCFFFVCKVVDYFFGVGEKSLLKKIWGWGGGRIGSPTVWWCLPGGFPPPLLVFRWTKKGFSPPTDFFKTPPPCQPTFLKANFRGQGVWATPPIGCPKGGGLGFVSPPALFPALPKNLFLLKLSGP